MREITLSLYDRGEGTNVAIQPLLDEFERKHHIHVNLKLYGWAESWAKLVEIALYGHGPDLSELGTTGVLDFVRMNALINFSPAELNIIGSEKDFFLINWRSSVVPGPSGDAPIVWAMPWTADIRLIFYDRKLVERAKIETATGFQNIDAIDETIGKLRDFSELPIAFSTLNTQINLHNLASWIWDAGGDLMAPDGKQVAFDSEKALRGIHSFFRLGRFLPAEYHKTDQFESERLFLSGKAAILCSGYWIIRDAPNDPTVLENIGIAAMPGASFVGGTNLAIWKHSLDREGALLLLDFLVKESAEYKLFPLFGLPAHVPSWKKVQFMEEPYFTILRDALQNGRTFPVGELWGLVEKRLVDAIPAVWERVLASDQSDIDKILADTIVPLAQRLNMSFL